MENERPTPLLEDTEGTRRKLESWLSEHRGHDVSIPHLDIPEATGMSNVTLLLEIEWQQEGQDRREALVGRLQPEIARPVFPVYDLSLQYEVMDSLGRNSNIPVPELRGLETDRSLLGVQFYFMKHIEGRIPTDMPPYNMDGWMVHETSEDQRTAMWNDAVDTMAQFHQLDYHDLGFSRLQETDTTPLKKQLDYWQAYMEWAMEGRDHAICADALGWLVENMPREEPTVLCWGDARLGNIIFKPALDGVAAVLDWEMATLGNPVQDLAWFNYLDATFSEGLGMPRLAGLPSYEDTVDRWEKASGQSADNYDYYLVFAGMRYGLILSRIMLATGQETEIQGNFACQLLQRYLERLG